MNPAVMNRAIVLALLLCVAPGAGAASFCVTTSAEFQSAYATARANNESNTIRLRTGTYATPSGGLGSTAPYDYDSPGTLVIEGGWQPLEAIPCGVQSSDPGASVIDGMQTNRGLRISVGSDGLDVTIRNLTFQGGRSLAAVTNDRGAGLDLAGSSTYVGDILIERCIFRDNAASLLAGALNVSTSGVVNLRNNLFTGNTAPVAAAVLVLDIDGAVTIGSNTFTQNVATTSNAQNAAMANDGSAVRVISNNILWHNTSGGQTDVIGDQGIYLNNLIETVTGAMQGGSAGNINADPQFAGASDFRLMTHSPAMDAGDSAPFGGVTTQDLAGQARISGPAIDLGAYEADSDRIFRDGLE